MVSEPSYFTVKTSSSGNCGRWERKHSISFPRNKSRTFLRGPSILRTYYEDDDSSEWAEEEDFLFRRRFRKLRRPRIYAHTIRGSKELRKRKWQLGDQRPAYSSTHKLRASEIYVCFGQRKIYIRLWLAQPFSLGWSKMSLGNFRFQRGLLRLETGKRESRMCRNLSLFFIQILNLSCEDERTVLLMPQ